MNYFVVDRGADGARKTTVALKAGHSPMHANKVLAELVEFPGRDARTNHLTGQAQSLFRKGSTNPEALDILGRLKLNH